MVAWADAGLVNRILCYAMSVRWQEISILGLISCELHPWMFACKKEDGESCHGDWYKARLHGRHAAAEIGVHTDIHHREVLHDYSC